ncbi:polymeric immunoglobulin receptor-like isoform X2 [Pygocentrus nattereri]|uniref:polymeric immunoglobulin receptor-like isoform X2 n=1 Tax=Pygocentrus nattereri TaxID=42514 RepID=UPI0018911266|nr:polymeric immunoglobulin receptor-like isoform X2 [Pygocentrus nattereri]
MFTVELKSLQDSDSGYYWCAVEISGGSDDGDYVYLTVSSDPAVSVINSRVSGQEGGSVSAQCLYRAEYQNKQKNWCRFKDWSCFTVGKTTTSQNSAVLVSDDEKGSVSVEMRGLQKSDAGWYWFSAGDVGVTVHLTVTERPSIVTTSLSSQETQESVNTPDSVSLKTLKNLAVRRRESLTIPCVYDEKYKSHRKYWCRGYYWSFCTIVAYTNPSGRTSVTDHPTQNMFTVELKSLQDSDSGYYWCHVEISGGSDDGDYVYLTVSSDPAVSVINSSVSGQEGGSVSVQCLYRAEYQNKQKKWCRFKDWSCFTVGKITTSQNSAVLVSDDEKGSVSVEMRGLQKSDAGWYWFSAGDVGVPVHLTVTERPSTVTTSLSSQETQESVNTPDSESLKTLKNLAVRHGGSLTIPCFYDEKYKSNLKYWCKGQEWLLCKIVAYTNTSGRTSVTDHPTQNMFTVELNSLQDSDSGYYWCAVEISDRSDDGDYVYLTVSSDPAVSVINSRVSGQEGGSVSAQCLYSAEYKNKQKKWCRFKDWTCFTVWKTTTSQNSAVLVTDYGKGSVSVEMSGLQKSDAGWYWFNAGDVGVTVHLTVTERPSTTAVTTNLSSQETQESMTTPEETTCSGTEKPKESQQFCLSHN